MNPKSTQLVAIDISKGSLEIQLAHKSLNLPNSPAGMKKLLKMLRPLEDPLVVFEATGGYERLLKQTLHEASIALCLVNPARVRAFAASEGLKAKTDPIDAQVLWRFAQEKRLKPLAAPSPDQIELTAHMDRRGQLTGELAREKTRLEKAPKVIAGFIEQMIGHLESQLQQVDGQIRRLIQANPSMKQAAARMQSVPGVGEVTTWTLLAYLQEIHSLNRNQIVALVGVAPYNKDSGATQKKRAISGGRAKVRKCLYMAAQSAARCNPVIKPYVQGLQDRGKPYKCAMVAAMRKLIIHLQSVLRNPEKGVA